MKDRGRMRGGDGYRAWFDPESGVLWVCGRGVLKQVMWKLIWEKFSRFPISKVVFEAAWGGRVVLPADCSHMFEGAFFEVVFPKDLDTSQVTDMSFMFADTAEANPDVSGWDTSRVENMSFMFSGAKKARPDISGWDMSQVTDMRGMFSSGSKEGEE